MDISKPKYLMLKYKFFTEMQGDYTTMRTRQIDLTLKSPTVIHKEIFTSILEGMTSILLLVMYLIILVLNLITLGLFGMLLDWIAFKSECKRDLYDSYTIYLYGKKVFQREI